MATTPTRLMTFAQFETLPNPRDGRFELRRGELVKVPPPKLKHSRVQETLHELLKQAAAGAGSVYVELGFRTLPEGEFRFSDVAYTARDRWERQDPEGYLSGAPDLVVEVLSSSNTAAQMFDKRVLCLENGCREFWLVDTRHCQVDISTADGHTITYKSGQEVPLFFGGRIPVDAIFS